MNKLITTLLGLVILAVLVICVMNMLGLGDMVSDAGNTIREKAGTTKTATAKSRAAETTDDFAMQALGWDIRDVNKKPVATVKQGIEKLANKIDELQRLKEQIKAADRKAGKVSARDSQEVANLRDALRDAKAKLLDPNTVYPLKIKTYTYANREMLKASFDKMKSRYDSLKATSTYSGNNPARTAQVVMKIERQLRVARSMMDLLESKLAWAETSELDTKASANEKDLTEFSSRAEAILSDPLDIPVGPATESERIEKELNDFND